MKRSRWSDEQIEELLNQMPKIEDNRDKKEIYQNITVKMNRRKQRFRMMPMVATAAAALLFFILAPNLLNWQISENKSMEDISNRSMTEQKVEQDAKFDNSAKESEVEEAKESYDMSSYEESSDSGVGFKALTMMDGTTALYEEDVVGMEVLTYNIPDKNAQNVIPISVLVEKEENKTKFDLFEEYMGRLAEEDWGLLDYYPLEADLHYEQENRVLTANVPKAHSYSESTTKERILNYVLSSTMNDYNIDKIKLMTEGNPGIDFSHYGFQEEFVPVYSVGNHAYYFYYPNDTMTKPYIVPFIEKQMSSVTEALLEMKEAPQKNSLLASIPFEWDFETVENPETKLLTLRFNNAPTMSNVESTVHTIEAILLTAKEFNYQAVKFENVSTDMIGRFNLHDELKVPVAANKQQLP